MRDERPLVLVAPVKGALRLAACDAAAFRLELKPGMALADARAMHPAIDVADADPAADADLLASVGEWCRRWTPLMAIDPPDGIALDISGVAHLFGGEAAMRAEIVARLTAQGFALRAAIAGTPEAAWALARHGGRDAAIVAPGGEEEALGALPVEALRPDAATADALRRVGLVSVDHILLRPRAPIAARFGPALLDRLDAALGRTRSPIAATIETAPYIAEKRFFDPIITPEDIERTLLKLAHELSAMLVHHGEGARRIEALLFRVDGATRRIAVGASRPLREPEIMIRLLRERLVHSGDEIDVGYGFDVVRLSALETSMREERQGDLAGDAHREDLSRLIDTLGARLGAGRVERLQACDSHWPEWAAVATPAARAEAERATPEWNPARRSGEPPDRPIRLLATPEPVETIAAVPDGPPLRFRWRRVLHEVVHVEGPERIAAEWWRGDGPTRDYFRAEDSEGRRFWLFRDGLYRETQAPRWFMHGFFA